MRKRTFAAILAAALVVGFTVTMATPAAATPLPDPNWNEIYNPFLWNGSYNQCLDDPGGSTTVLQPMQVYHCHGSASNGAPQRFRFIDIYGDGVDYLVMNLASYQCLTLAINEVGLYNEPVRQAPCGDGRQGCTQTNGCNAWTMLGTPNGSDYFALHNAITPNTCMKVASFGGNSTPVVTVKCDVSDPLQNWLLG